MTSSAEMSVPAQPTKQKGRIAQSIIDALYLVTCNAGTEIPSSGGDL